MAFEKICTLDDVWEGEMENFESVDGQDILVICVDGGGFKAFQGLCPHQEIMLVEGQYEKGVLTCRAHLWQFDCKTGKGINPDDCQIAEYPVKVENEDVFIDTADVVALKSHA